MGRSGSGSGSGRDVASRTSVEVDKKQKKAKFKPIKQTYTVIYNQLLLNMSGHRNIKSTSESKQLVDLSNCGFE